MSTSTFDFVTARPGFTFPQSLTEKYRPRAISGFAGLEKAKRTFTNVRDSMRGTGKRPLPKALLLIGKPGSGKTSLTMALAEETPCTLLQVAAGDFDKGALQTIRERTIYYPAVGKYWVILADEIDRASFAAQVGLLSALDETSSLMPAFGGGMRQGAPSNVLWIFSCNGQGRMNIEPPECFERRFLSRCVTVPFSTYGDSEAVVNYVRGVWDSEKDSFDNGEVDMPDFDLIVKTSNTSVRESLNALEARMLAS